jgi:RNA polymerase sigma-70 factor (ECF subfamily)
MRETTTDNPLAIADERSDHSLLLRYRSGQRDAATKLYLRYAGRLQRLALAQTAPDLRPRFDPDDVVQSVFRTFFRRVSRGLYDVPPGDELWQLLLVLALNKIRKLATYHRAQKRDVRRTVGSLELEPEANTLSSDDEGSLRILRMVIDELLMELTPVQRSIVELRIQGEDADSISQRTERSKRTVERTVRDFRLKLGELIESSDLPPRSD